MPGRRGHEVTTYAARSLWASGTGGLSSAILAECKPGSVAGIDPSEVFLDAARARVTDSRFRCRQGSAEALPFEDGVALYVWDYAGHMQIMPLAELFGGTRSGPKYCSSLAPDAQARLREKLRSRLPTGPDGEILLAVRAWAVKGKIAR